MAPGKQGKKTRASRLTANLNHFLGGGKWAKRSHNGYLEGIGPSGAIQGWAYDGQDPHRRVCVFFFVQGEIVGSVVADQFRRDLEVANKADGHCGFVLRRLTVRSDDILTPGVSLHAYFDPEGTQELANSPLVLEGSALQLVRSRALVDCRHKLISTPERVPTGYFEGISPTGAICGWARDPAVPERRVTVYLHADDQLIAPCPADLFRGDLQQAGQGDGQHGFSLQRIPHAILGRLTPGAVLRASIDPEGLSELPNSPLTLGADDLDRLTIGALDSSRTDLSLAERSVGLAKLLQWLAPTTASEAPRNATEEWTQSVYGHALGFCRDLFDLGEYATLASCLTTDVLGAARKARWRTLELDLYRSFVSVFSGALDEATLDVLELGIHRAVSRGTATQSRAWYDAHMKSSLIHLFNTFSLELYPADIAEAHSQSRRQRYIQLVAYCLTNVYHDHMLAMNFLNLLNPGEAAINDAAFCALSGRTNQHLGRNYEAVRDFLKAKALGSTSWRVYHEAGMLLSRICEGRIELLRAKRTQVMALLTEGLRLNPDQSAGIKVAEGFLHHFFLASVTHTMRLAHSGALAAALRQRRDDLAELATSVEALSALHRGTDPCSGTVAGPPIRRDFRRVLFVASKALWQCFYYRVSEKMDQIASLPHWEARVIEFEALPQDTWKAALMDVDMVYLCRVPATYEVLDLIQYVRSLRLPIAYDIDDYTFDTRFFPSPLASYAGTIDESQHVHLTMDCPFVEQAIALSDLVTCSTAPLAAKIRERFGRGRPVIVHPNVLSDELYYQATGITDADADRGPDDAMAPQRECITIFYGSATKAHKQILYQQLFPALATVLERYPSVYLKLVGHINLPRELAAFRDRIDVAAPTPDYGAYIGHVRRADINLAVLEQDPFTDCKSEIKWLEAAAFGIPSVLSPSATYLDVLKGDTHALFAAAQDEWVTQLGRLIESKDLRRRIGQAARSHALQAYRPAVGAEILQTTLSEARAICPPGTSKPRLLFVNVFFSPQSIGGATRVVESHIRCLMERYGDEYELHVLTTEAEPQHWTPYSVEQYYYGSALVTKLRVPARSWGDHQDERVYHWCMEFFRSYRFALIHFHAIQVLTASAVDAARILGIPYLITLHDAWWLSRHLFLIDEDGNHVDPANPLSGEERGSPETGWLINRRRHLERCLRNATAVMAVSDKFKRLHEEALRLPGILVNENGLEPFEVLPRIPNPNCNDQGFPLIRVAHIGGMSRHKGYHLFREAISNGQFRNLEVLVVDSSLDAGQRYIDTWGSTPVTFLPKFKQHEINQLYATIDVLVAPSLWPESFGLVTREAAYAGVWVIASDRGAIGDGIEEGTGRVVTVSDSSGLRSALREIDGAPTRFTVQRPSAPFRGVDDQVRECLVEYRKLVSVGPVGHQIAPSLQA